MACVVLVGVPVMLAEFSLGSRARADVLAAFGARGPWRTAGALALSAAFLILSYYAVVAGWAAKYLFDYASGSLRQPALEDFALRFSAFLSSPAAFSVKRVVADAERA